jgi:hypothetical protein
VSDFWLPQSHRDRYQQWQDLLAACRTIVQGPETDGPALRAQLLQVQQFFQEQVGPLDLADLDGAIAPRVQAVRTEMQKELRLLVMDGMFLQAARQSATQQQRQAQLGDRLEKLAGYCQVLVEAERPAS